MPALYAPTVVVNNETLAIKPNTFEYDDGFGERSVRVASSGGGQTKQITSENIETKKSMCKFVLHATSEDVDRLRGWLANGDANAVEVTDKGGFSRTFLQAIVVNNPTPKLGTDGEFEVEFSSRPAV